MCYSHSGLEFLCFIFILTYMLRVSREALILKNLNSHLRIQANGNSVAKQSNRSSLLGMAER